MSEHETSDLALVNGRVWPAGTGGPTAVRVHRGLIDLVGSDADVLADRTPSTQVLDVGGRPILPAFTDSHTHYHRYAILRRHYLDFDDPSFKSIADIIDAVAARSREKPIGTWLQGDNLLAGRLREGQLPTRHELDAVAPQHPVLLRGAGKHLVVANSLALHLAGIDRDTADPPGGRIERDPAGEPTGVLHERGKLRLDTTRADTVVPPLADDERLRALADSMRDLHRRGVTTIHEITRTPEEFGDYLRLRERGELSVRVVSYVRVVEARAHLDDLISIGLRSGYGDDWLRLGGVKVSIDGSCTLKNAAVYEPYPGEPENFGLVRIGQHELDDVVRVADANGLAVAVHAIGPRAVDMALDAFERVRADGAPRVLRHRIEHAYLPPQRGQFERMRRLALLLSIQPGFIATVGDIWIDIFGGDAAKHMVALRSAITAGLTVLANSDCPTAPVDPLLCIAAAVGRTTRRGQSLGTEQAVSVEEAVTMQTATPAFAACQEWRAGRIERRMLGDLVVLGEDPRAVPASEIAAIPVSATVIDGHLVFEGSLA